MIWEQEQLETVYELFERLGTEVHDDPVYVRTPHGSYYFVVQGVERVMVEGEQRTVIVVREVEWEGEKPSEPVMGFDKNYGLPFVKRQS